MLFKKTLLVTAMIAFGGFVASSMAASPATANFNVKLKINSACTVTATDAAFTAVDANVTTDQTVDATDNISVVCSKNTAYTIGLLPSSTNTNGTGSMAGTGSNTDKVAYALYQEASDTNAWGDATTNRVAGVTDTVGNTTKTYSVHAKVLGSALNVTPDTYTDAVAVHVYY